MEITHFIFVSVWIGYSLPWVYVSGEPKREITFFPVYRAAVVRDLLLFKNNNNLYIFLTHLFQIGTRFWLICKVQVSEFLFQVTAPSLFRFWLFYL